MKTKLNFILGLALLLAGVSWSQCGSLNAAMAIQENNVNATEFADTLNQIEAAHRAYRKDLKFPTKYEFTFSAITEYPGSDRKAIEEFTYSIEGKYGVGTISRGTNRSGSSPRTGILLSNSSYHARISKAGDDSFFMDSVTQNELTVPILTNHLLSPFEYVDFLRDSEIRPKRVQIQGDALVIEIENTPRGSVPEAASRVLYRFQKDSYYLPQEIVFTVPMDGSITTMTHSYKYQADPKTGMPIWQEKSLEISNASVVEQRTISKFSINWEPSKLDRAKCYLSYYGLPEPNFPTKSSLAIWLGFAGILVGAFGALLLWKRMRLTR